MGKKSREKGAAAEREVAGLLRPVYPQARRRCSGEESQDDIQGRDIEGTPGLCVQVQCAGRIDPHLKLEQAVEAAHPGEIPVAVVRRVTRSIRGRPYLVTMRISDFLAIMAIAREHGA